MKSWRESKSNDFLRSKKVGLCLCPPLLYLIIEEPQHLTSICTWKAILNKKWREIIQRVSDLVDASADGECINLALNVSNDFSKNGWCSISSKKLIHLSRDLSCRLFSTSHRQPGRISPILPAIFPNKLSKSICQWKRKSLDFHQTN